MLRWLRDLINTFKRPINGDVPNYGNIPDEILEQHFFGDSEAQMETARRIMRRDRDLLRKLKDK